MNEGVNYVNIKDFVDNGLLMEANRLFFHPLGLALTVEKNEKGEMFIKGIQYTDNPQGFVFLKLNRKKLQKAKKYRRERLNKRKEALGFTIQTQDFV